MPVQQPPNVRQPLTAIYHHVKGRKQEKADTSEMVQLIILKNEQAFSVLYDNYSHALYSVLVKLVQRKEVADDLLQDVFVKIWKNIQLFDAAKGTLFTWMLNIARNRAIDYLRSKGHRLQQLTLSDELVEVCKDFVANTAHHYTYTEGKEAAGKANELELKYAEVIDLVFFYGCTHEETATILQLPLGTVKTRVRRAIQLIKELY